MVGRNVNREHITSPSVVNEMLLLEEMQTTGLVCFSCPFMKARYNGLPYTLTRPSPDPQLMSTVPFNLRRLPISNVALE